MKLFAAHLSRRPGEKSRFNDPMNGSLFPSKIPTETVGRKSFLHTNVGFG